MRRAFKQILSVVRFRQRVRPLKREAYKFAAGAAPYGQAEAEALLNAERQKIEADERSGRWLIKYYNKGAETYRTTATWPRRTEVWPGARHHPNHSHRKRDRPRLGRRV